MDGGLLCGAGEGGLPKDSKGTRVQSPRKLVRRFLTINPVNKLEANLIVRPVQFPSWASPVPSKGSKWLMDRKGFRGIL